MVSRRKVSKLEIIRHKSDYDQFYIASKEEAQEQTEVAQLVVEEVEKYISSKIKKKN